MRSTVSMRRSAPLAIGLLIVTGVALWQIESADARNAYLDTFVAQYSSVPGLEASALNDCSLCHVGSGFGTRNQFGMDFQAASGFPNAAAFVAIENIDSDGDGATNIEEIQALTSPGDATDTPTTTTTTTEPTTTTTEPTTTTTEPTTTTTEPTTTTTEPTTTTTEPTTTTTEPTTTTTTEPTTTTTEPTTTTTEPTTTTTEPTTTTTMPPTTTTTMPPTTTTTVPADTLTFEADGAGKVTLRVDGRELELASVMPNDGWRYFVKTAGCKHGYDHWDADEYDDYDDDDDDDYDDDDGCLIKVRFRNGESRVDFKAWLKRGEIVTDVKVKTVKGHAYGYGHDWDDDDHDDDHNDDDYDDDKGRGKDHDEDDD